MKIYNSITELPNKLAIFPLTGAVLFPQTQLPLNIFEPRYLNMIDEVLSSPDRIMGMIQPNISKNDPNSKNLKRVGCAGRISSFSETGDGRYLVTLTGLIRFEVNNELDTTTQYRQAITNYDNYKEDLLPANVENIDRKSLLILIKKYLEQRNLLIDWEIIEQSPTEQLINYSGVLVPFEPEEKQLLLETKSLFDRCKTLESLFQSYQFQNNQDSNSSELH
ncbi:LON peptidase substrate-binding domain-containing protein [Pelagibacterales bacterium]|jgi:Lon protease-like protein|nr:LON peptidase substrate-binding domain-containing protein [Pelagibacterales bacterium]MDB9985455.1 LON peptidase substrate-binding domain-containing protein [Pelagibacterales bacterium]